MADTKAICLKNKTTEIFRSTMGLSSSVSLLKQKTALLLSLLFVVSCSLEATISQLSLAPDIVEISSDKLAVTNDVVHLVLKFAEPQSNLTLSSIQVTNGVLSNLSGGPLEFQVTLQPTSDGVVEIKIPGKKITSALHISNGEIYSDSYQIIYDTTPPVVSSLQRVDPVTSPFTQFIVQIRATVNEDESYVEFFSDSMCSTVVGSATAVAGNATLSSNVFTSGVYRYYVKATDIAGNISSCSLSYASYELDVTPPDLTDLNIVLQVPVSSPGTNKRPTIRVSDFDDAHAVYLYKDSSCTAGSFYGSSYTSGSSFVDITTNTDLVDGEYKFYVRLSDSLSNNSACSVNYATYIVDTGAPSPATSLTLQNPNVSPGNDNTPTIRVAGVESGATVSLYTNNTCTVGALVGSGVSSGTSIDITSSALADGSHTFYANVVDIVGNSSGCSTASVTYVLDTQASATPTLALFDPASSPSNDLTPVFRVSGVVVGETIKLYSNNTCTTEVATGVASSATIDLTPSTVVVGLNNFYARAIDSLGNMSACSSGVSYELDTVAPNAPTALALQNPLLSPSNDTTPTIRVSGVVSGDVIRLYKDNTCTAPNLMASGTASGTTIDLTSSVLTEGSYVFYARSTDPAGNSSTCSAASVAYELDLTAPAITVNLTLVNPLSSPSNVQKPTIRVAGVSSGDTVSITHSNTCSIFIATEVSTGTSVDLLISGAFIDGTYNFYVQVQDSAGNTTACLNGGLSYTVDTIAPSAPSSLVLHEPTTSPNNDKTPTIRVGGVVAGDTISLFTQNNCSVGSEVASSVASNTTIDLTPSTELADGNYTFYSRSRDPAGNQSTCSTANVNYELDTIAPSNAVTLTLQSPATSPGNDSTPTIRVSSVAMNDTVKLYTNNTCTTEVASGVAAGTSIDLTSSALVEGNYYFYARVTDASGNISACSTNSVYYSLDLTPSNPPNSLTLQNPSTSPSNDTTPTVRVHGVTSGDTISLYKDSSCSAPHQVATGTAAGTVIDLTSTALVDGVYALYAQAIDPQGNISTCSTATVSYTVDTVAPAAPASFVLKNPTTTPNKNKNPEFTVGGVEVGSRIILYRVPGCSTVTSGYVDSNAAVMDVTSSTLADGLYTFSVLLMDTAGNLSTCYPGSILYQVDNTASAAPTGLALQAPAISPSNDSTPTIRVSGVVNSDTVRLYTNDSCTTEVGSAVSAGTQVDITSTVLVEGVYDFYAKSIDMAGNESSCSTNKVTYNLDTTKPTVTLSTTAPSVTMESVIDVSVTVSEAVTGFTLADISVTNGIAQNLTGSGTSYNFQVAHSASGAVSVQVIADGLADTAGNLNTASSILNYTYEKAIWSQQAYIKTPNTDAGDALGFSEFNNSVFGSSMLSIDGDTLAIGSVGEASNQTTITNGSGASLNNGASQSGAVYIFRRSGVNWVGEAYIKSANAEANDWFGTSLDLQGDTLVVGAAREDSNQTTITNAATASSNNSMSDAGAVYIYKRSGSTWTQQAYIKAVNNHAAYFGSSVSLDGNTLAVGAIAEGSSQTTITNGATASSSLTRAESGAVYVYYRIGNNWSQQAYIKASNADSGDLFGLVSLSGDRLAVSALRESSNQTTINNSGVASSDNSASKSGAVYIFKRTGTNWVQEAYIKAVNADVDDQFGYSISLFGDTLAVSTPTEGSTQQTITNGTGADADNSLPVRGAVYIYRYSGSSWAQEAYIKSSNLHSYFFGRSVSLDKDALSVGALGDYYKAYGVSNTSGSNGIDLTEDNMPEYGLPISGAVYMYRRTGNQWAQEAYIKAFNADQSDMFGTTVSLDRNSLAVVAPHEASNQITITNGNTASADNSLAQSGAVYVYTRNEAVAVISAGIPEEIAASSSINMDLGGSNITHYRYKVGPVGSTDCSDLSGYSASISVGTTLSADLSSYSDGEMIVCIIGQTATGLWQTPANATTHKWIKDSSAPTNPSNVTDGVVEWTDSTTTPAITWTASTDSGGAVTYEVSLGTSAGSTNLMGWTSTGSSSTNWSGTGLSLTYGVNVYVNVRAKDIVGNVSGVASSDGYLLKFYGWKQQAYLKAYNSEANTLYGIGLGVSGDTVVVGSPFEKSTQTTITNGTSVSFDVSGSNVGATYIYRRSGNNWEQEAYLKAPNAESGDMFGYIVAIDADTVAVSSVYEASSQTTISNDTTASADNSLNGSGAVYVFKRVGTNWHQEAYIKASNSQSSMQFGSSMSISGDTLAVGVPMEASEFTTITNGPMAPVPVSPVTQTGAVYIYKRTGTTWAQEAYIKAVNANQGDLFGQKVAISGDTVAVSATYEDSTQTTITNGSTAATGDASNTANVGAVYVYKRTGTTWAQEAYIKAANAEANDNFGAMLSLDGDTLVVSSVSEDSSQSFISNSTSASSDNSMSNAGAVYVYKRTGVNWAQEAYIKASNVNANDYFAVVSLSGDFLAVAAPYEDSAQTTINNGTTLASADNSLENSGAVYVFKRTGTNWAQTAYIKAVNAGNEDGFGNMLCLDGTTLAVGTPTEDSNYRGIMNGQTASSDNTATNSGAVYIYEFSE